MKLAEAAIEEQICQYLALDGWYTRHFELNYSERKQRSCGERGMPDILAVRYSKPGWANILWIECKRPGGRISVDQRAWRDRERRRGALVVLAGIDFEPSIDGFAGWYSESGLEVRPLQLGGRKRSA
jgi:hypothetical protein